MLVNKKDYARASFQGNHKSFRVTAKIQLRKFRFKEAVKLV